MPEENNLVAMTIEVVASYVSHNTIKPEDVPDFIAKTHGAITGISKEPDAPAEDAPPAEETFTPAVTVRKSLASRNHIVSMIDGRPYKALKRHLGTHGLTPAEYRTRYGLKADYPMVAPGYSEQRREVAQRLGLGRKRQMPAPAEEEPAARSPQPEAESVTPPAPKTTRARKAKAAEAAAPTTETLQPEVGTAAPATPKTPRGRKAKAAASAPEARPAPAKVTRRRKAPPDAPSNEA